MNFKQALIAHLQGDKVQKRSEWKHEWAPFMEGSEHATLSQILDPSFGSKCEYRLAPRTIMCNGVEVLAPEKVAPKNGSEYYVANPLNPDCTVRFLCWDGCDLELKYLELGLVYLTKEDAIARAKAMLITS